MAIGDKKRKYDAAFKQEALQLLNSSRKSIWQIEDELEITPGFLNKWKARYRLHLVTDKVKPSESCKKGCEVVFNGCAMYLKFELQAILDNDSLHSQG